MELPGKKIHLDPTTWPYVKHINSDLIYKSMHIPIRTEILNTMYRTLGDFDKNSCPAAADVMTLQFFAESIKNVLRHRGANYGRKFTGREPRVSVMLTYITRRLWENDEDRKGLWEMETLLTESNIVGILYSIVVLDEDIDFADAVSDQMVINVLGAPKFRKARGAAAAGANNRRNNNDSDSDNEVEEVVVNPLDEARPDVPGTRLDDRASKYYFPTNREGGSTLHPSIVYSTHPNNMFRRINTLESYIRVMCNAVAGVTGSVPGQTSDDVFVNSLPPGNPFLPENVFSLDNALAKFADWGADPVFCQREHWFSLDRPDTHGSETFGAPYWRGGTTASGEDYPSNLAQCSALLHIKHFTAAGLMDYCLPHTEIVDQSIIRPRGERDRTMIGTGDGEYCLEDYLGTIGYKTMAANIKSDNSANIHLDIFNDYFNSMAPISAEIDELLTDIDNSSIEYQTRLKTLQNQGFAFYNSVMDPNNSNLPKGYLALQLHIWDRKSWIPKSQPMWQTDAVAMSPFAQLRVRDMILDDALIKLSDSTLLLKNRMMRSIYTIALPRIGPQQNKEHIQYVGTPGTSKSHTLDAITELLIPGTFETNSGGSMMGMVGTFRSERMLTVYHELPNLLAPDGDYKGDADKHLRMKLTQLSEGITQYSTTREVSLPNGDKVREGYTQKADFTNVVLGARNVKYVRTTSGSAVEAMYDRFTITQQRQILAPGRVKLISRVLDASRTKINSGYTKLKEHQHYIHRAILEYGAAICCYAVPMPDLALFTALAPLAMGYLSQLRPELHFQLRNIARIKTRIYVEVILYAIRMALCSPLAPTAEKTVRADGTTKLEFTEYRSKEALQEISKYAYCTMDQLTFVITEAMYELTSAESFVITRAFAEKHCNFYSLGRLPQDSRPDEERRQWDMSADAAPRPPHLAEIEERVPSRGRLIPFIKRLKSTGKYLLNLPVGVHITRQKQSIGKSGRAAQYAAFELQPVAIEEEFEDLFMLNAPVASTAFKLDRSEKVVYKEEYKGNVTYINPNYVAIKNDIQTFANLVAGKIGDYSLREDAIKDLLHDLRKKQIVTPYLPVIDTTDALAKSLDDIQSLRYIHSAMNKFPKYKVPVLIVDPHEGEFFILISYFETNPYEVVKSMLDHISYHATRRRKTIMGIPSQKHCLHYEPIEIRPITDKPLIMARHTNINLQTIGILKEFCDGELPEVTDAPDFYLKKDMEEEFAMEYLKRYNPTADHGTLRNYTPAGIWDQLYGEGGFYRINTADLNEKPYPETLIEPEVTKDTPPPRPIQHRRKMPFQPPIAVLGKRKDVAAAEEEAKRQRTVEGTQNYGSMQIHRHDVNFL